MTATRDLTVGATWRRLHDLGYAATSATHPDRMASPRAHSGQRDSFITLADHAGAIMLHPTRANGALESLENLAQRQVIVLLVTAYLLADPRQSKAVHSVLSDFGLLSGPASTDGFGNCRHLLRWNGPPIFDGEAAARLCFDADDRTVLLEHAIAPGRYAQRSDEWGGTRRVAAEPVGSHIVALDGEWKGGDPLSTPHDRLPELLAPDVTRLISAIEDARWSARPLAAQKEAAA